MASPREKEREEQPNCVTNGRYRSLLLFREDLTALMLVPDINTTKDVKMSAQTMSVSNHSAIKLFSRSPTILSFTDSWTDTLKNMTAI